MKKYYIILLLTSLYAILTSCTSHDDVIAEPEDGVYQFDLVISVARQNGMRMTNEVIQAENQPFRGLQSLTAIPYITNGPVTANDEAKTSTFTRAVINRIDIDGGYHYYLVVNCSFARNTNHLLVYAQASTVPGMATDTQNGKLVATLSETADQKPSAFSFSLQSIRETDESHAEAQELADYMTAIANTTGWSTTTNSVLRAYYSSFIHANADGNGLMAGSAANVKAYVAALRAQLQTVNDPLSTAIIANIDNNSSIADNTYPSSLGLPDGSTALRWNDGAFTVRTTTTPLDNINNVTRYTYPAELWYYANSAIRTSRDEVSKTTYESTYWDELLSHYYTTGSEVTSETKSVAIADPLQYGVGRLQVSLSPITGTLNDSKGAVVNYGDASKLPLTAVLIGGQHTVGFDFKPVGEPSDVDARFIYDPIVGSADASGVYTVNTLVLQSYDNEKVPVILEFQNNSGQQFAGKDGIVYPGTKFYLIAQIDPAGKGEGVYANRVFTQDYTTKMTMKVTSLENAYSCMPDLLQPRLEVGVEVQTQWIQSTTTIVKL